MKAKVVSETYENIAVGKWQIRQFQINDPTLA